MSETNVFTTFLMILFFIGYFAYFLFKALTRTFWDIGVKRWELHERERCGAAKELKSPQEVKEPKQGTVGLHEQIQKGSPHERGPYPTHPSIYPNNPQNSYYPSQVYQGPSLWGRDGYDHEYDHQYIPEQMSYGPYNPHPYNPHPNPHPNPQPYNPHP